MKLLPSYNTIPIGRMLKHMFEREYEISVITPQDTKARCMEIRRITYLADAINFVFTCKAAQKWPIGAEFKIN